MTLRTLLRIRHSSLIHTITTTTGSTAPINHIHCSSIRWSSSSTTAPSAAAAQNFDVRIMEVGPRDGLQNESSMIVPVQQKVQFIQLLVNAGCRHIEVGSFVNPNAVPNMANSPEVVQQLQNMTHSTTTTAVQFSALVPTLRYLQEALMYRDTLHEIAIFASASETFSQKVYIVKKKEREREKRSHR